MFDLKHPFVKFGVPGLGSVVSALMLGLTHPVTLAFVVGGVAVNVVLKLKG